MSEKPYDIQQRTILLGLNIIRLSEHLPHNQIGKVLCNQLVRAGTSVGANMEETTAASSKQDFIYKTNISVVKQEKPTIGFDLSKKVE
jgi:four helix bundle protein